MLAASRSWRAARLTIGLVPTMGALHAGHLRLIDAARRENDRVIVSIFVNPIQFGEGEDFERYPRDAEGDTSMLRKAGADTVYRPPADAMYPPGSATRVHVRDLSDVLEGASRPGHFEGVATVVAKLFGAAEPDRAYFGQKDAQQVAVVRRLATDLDTGVEIRVCPTLRETDGLALSSRNAYLSPEERRAAVSLSAALREAAVAYGEGEKRPEKLKALLRKKLAAEPLAQVDYAELVDPVTFRSPGTLAVIAVRIGKTRLIDNHDLGNPYSG